MGKITKVEEEVDDENDGILSNHMLGVILVLNKKQNNQIFVTRIKDQCSWCHNFLISCPIQEREVSLQSQSKELKELKLISNRILFSYYQIIIN